MGMSPSVGAHLRIRYVRYGLSVVGVMLTGAVEAALRLSDSADNGTLSWLAWGAFWFAIGTAGSLKQRGRSMAGFAAQAGILAAVVGGWIVADPAVTDIPEVAAALAFAAALALMASGALSWLAAWSGEYVVDEGQPRLPGPYGQPGEKEPAQNYTELWLRVAGCLIGLALFAYGWVVGAHHAAGYAMVGVGAVAILMALFFRRL